MERQFSILVVDDEPQNCRLLHALLTPHGYSVETASSGGEALALIAAEQPDLVLLDIVMPELNGYDVCRRLREDPSTHTLPVVMVTSSGDEDKVRAIDAGADEFISRPFNQLELFARVRSLLRIKRYHDTIKSQAAALADSNRFLEERVREQVSELERAGKLRRFLPPQVADVILSEHDDAVVASHRREITVVFCDLRGFTAFSETAEPEAVMAVLGQFHAELGQLVIQFEGTVERFAGDRMMLFFNDPFPCPDPPLRAVRMAQAMQEQVAELTVGWRKRGYDLALGIGIAVGYATMGQIGFGGRFDYGAVGPVVNLAERLCGQALGGQILLSAAVFAAVENVVSAEEQCPLILEGFHDPVRAYLVVVHEAAHPTDQGSFVREGEFWTVGFGDRLVRLKDSKGLQDIARLLAAPGREVAAVDLATFAPSGTTATAAARTLSEPGFGLERDAGPSLDAEARQQYRQRLGELEEELTNSEAANDLERAARTRQEREFLLAELGAAVGLGGRDRRILDPAERARKAVTGRIRDAISRVEVTHSDLGHHLRRSIRTGAFIVYDPPTPVRWRF